jgi:hypothetical protein
VALGGYVYHVLNRANGRLCIFRKAGHLRTFEHILAFANAGLGAGEPSVLGLQALAASCLVFLDRLRLLFTGGQIAYTAAMPKRQE